MNFTEKKKRFSVISANFGKKMNKNAEKQASDASIHMGFQQLVENCFGNFPLLQLGKNSYQKLLENFCGKRYTGCGNTEKRAKKKNRPFSARNFPQKSTENPHPESLEKPDFSAAFDLFGDLVDRCIENRIG